MLFGCSGRRIRPAKMTRRPFLATFSTARRLVTCSNTSSCCTYKPCLCCCNFPGHFLTLGRFFLGVGIRNDLNNIIILGIFLLCKGSLNHSMGIIIFIIRITVTSDSDWSSLYIYSYLVQWCLHHPNLHVALVCSWVANHHSFGCGKVCVGHVKRILILVPSWITLFSATTIPHFRAQLESCWRACRVLPLDELSRRSRRLLQGRSLCVVLRAQAFMVARATHVVGGILTPLRY